MLIDSTLHLQMRNTIVSSLHIIRESSGREGVKLRKSKPTQAAGRSAWSIFWLCVCSVKHLRHSLCPSDQFSSEDTAVLLRAFAQVCFIGTCGCGMGGQVPTITTYLYSRGLSYPPSNVRSHALNGTAGVDVRKQRRATPKPVFV